MIKQGILNPAISSLLARIRHTNMLVIADRGFPYFPALETVDISLVDGIPSVLQVLNAIRPNYDIVKIYMAGEFLLALDGFCDELEVGGADAEDALGVHAVLPVDFAELLSAFAPQGGHDRCDGGHGVLLLGMKGPDSVDGNAMGRF